MVFSETLLNFEFLQYIVVISTDWIVAAYLVSKSFYFTETKWPLCSIGFRLIRAPSVTNMLVSVAFAVFIEASTLAVYLYLRYISNVTYMEFCVNQAHLNLTNRIALEHCIKFARIIFRVAAVHSCCFTIIYWALYSLILFQNFEFIQRHHVDFEVQFNQGPAMVFMIVSALIFLHEIPALQTEFRSLFNKTKIISVAPMSSSMVISQEEMRQSEGEERLEHLSLQWAAAYQSEQMETTF